MTNPVADETTREVQSGGNAGGTPGAACAAGCARVTAGNVGGAAQEARPPIDVCSIDLTKPGDVMLLHRALVNGWDVPQHSRDSLVEQLVPGLDAAQARVDAAPPRLKARYAMQIVKLVRIALLMDARNAIELDGHPKGWYPYLRGRKPEKRKPRINRQALRVQAAIAHKAAREAAATNNCPEAR